MQNKRLFPFCKCAHVREGDVFKLSKNYKLCHTVKKEKKEKILYSHLLLRFTIKHVLLLPESTLIDVKRP